MFLRKLFVILMVMVLAVSFSACSKKDPNEVLKVGDWTLSTDEFHEICLQRWGTLNNAAEKSVEELEEFLDDQLVRRLKIVDGYDKGLDNDPDVKEELDRARNRMAITELYQSEILNKIISEETMREFYNHDKEEIHASHILIKTEKGHDGIVSPATIKKAKKKIDDIYRQVRMPGADFAKLAREYSEDKSAPDGDLNWFQWGMMVPQFQDVAFSMSPAASSRSE